MKVNIDFETRSTVDLKQAGAHVYAAHPTTEVMCMAWYLEGYGGPLLWWPWQPFPERLAEAIEAGAEVHAWNAAFERLMWPVLERQHGAPPVALEQWRCTMVRALLQGFPAALDHAAPSMGLDVGKDKAGHQLMMRVSKPRKVFGPYDAHYREARERAEEQPANQLREFTLVERPDGRQDVVQWWVTPDRMTRLGQYCVRDVDVERAAGAFLDPIPAGELEGWRLDQRINDRGFYVDMDLVHKAKGLVKPAIDAANRELSRLTGGELKSVTKPNEIRAWLNKRLGLELDSIDKQTLSILMAEHPALSGDSPTDPVAVQVIQLRQAAAKTSTAKLNALIRGTGSDGLFRGGLQYAGAGRTSRWAGRRFQPQNIPRPEWWALEAIPLVMDGDIPKIELLLGNPLEAISSILRSCITARPGHELSVADYNAIEARVAAWLAGAVKILEAYATNQDPYRIMASTIFGYADWRDVPKGGIERFLGKKLILGAQYGLGKRRFWESCREDGLFIERDLADRSIDAYRTDNWQIPAAWRALDDAALYAMQNPYTWTPCLGGKIHFFRDDNYLRMRLPSGRQLSYLYPRLVPDVTPWGAETYKIEFWGWNGMKNRMEWQTMWGGRWMENACQAISRDLMLDAALRLDKAGWKIILSVHDELLTDNPAGERDYRDLEAEMSKAPAWAADLPLKVEGWTGHRYRK